MAEVRRPKTRRREPDPAGTIRVRRPATLILDAVDVADVLCVMGCDWTDARRLSASLMRAVALADQRGAPHVAVLDSRLATVELLHYARPPKDQVAFAAACRKFGGAYLAGRPRGGYRVLIAAGPAES